MSTEGNVQRKTLSHRRQMLLSNRRQRLLSNRRQWLLSNRRQRLTQILTLLLEPIPSNTHLIYRGSQTACNCKLNYHDSCTLCRGLYPVSMHSDFITFWRLEKPPCCHAPDNTITLPWCEARRSLHAFTKVNPKSYILLCHRFSLVGYNRIPSGPFHNCKGFPILGTTEYPQAPLAPCGLVGIAIPLPLFQQDNSLEPS
jgi:hypothetical protein